MLLKHGMVSIKNTIWTVANGIMQGHKVYVGGRGGRITHDIIRDDLGIQLVRHAEYGIVNKECVAMFHPDYIVAFERTWPDWDVDDPRDKESRNLGKINFYASGDYSRINEAAMLLVLTK